MGNPKGKDTPKAGPRRSAIGDVTEPMRVLQLGDDEGEEVTDRDQRTRDQTNPSLNAPSEPTTERKPRATPPARRNTPAARPAPRIALACPQPPARPPALGDDEADGPATAVVNLLEQHWADERAGLKPVYDALLEAGRRLGGIKIVASPTCITFSRQREFAILTATPQGDRVFLGLALPGRPPTRRLLRARHFDWGERFTHAVTLRFKTDVDSEVRGWLTEACWAGG